MSILATVAVLAAVAGGCPNPPEVKAEGWIAGRAALKRVFMEREYGVRPVERPADLRFETAPDAEILGGTAVRREVRLSMTGPRGPFSFTAVAYLPKGARKVGSFVYVYLVRTAEREHFDRHAENPSTRSFPVADIVARGYAAVTFVNAEVALDSPKDCFSSGVFRAWGPSLAERRGTDWGAISAWAWGASRCLDWIGTQPEFDASRVAVIGHSRGGKTALWAGVTDERFALACVNNSGCSGAKLNHMVLPKSESIAVIVKHFPHWFCPNYFAFAGKEMEMDFDQHQLVALMAPRAVAVAVATLDDWAGQAGEFRSCELASPAWTAYGRQGLVAPDGMPKPDAAVQEGWISHHLRTGKHELAPSDWRRYMDFADRRMPPRVFADGDRVAFLGDSITHGGSYVGYLQLFHALRHPGVRAEIVNAGIAGDSAAGGLRRFDWDVAPMKPNRVFLMFGMNDVNHGLYAAGKAGPETDAARERVFADYRATVSNLSDRVAGIGARLTVMTPTPFDEYAVKSGRPAEKGCNEVGLRRLAEIARETPNADTVELYAPLTEILKRHPGRFQHDRVHPGGEGHLLIAASVLLALGETPTVGETVLAATDLPYRYAPKAFPLPLTPEYRKADEVFPVTEKLNRERLVVTGLAPGRWTLEADGRPVGIFTADEFAAGVNLALLPTPNQLEAQGLASVAAELASAMSRLRGLAQARHDLKEKAGDFTDREKVFAALDAANEERAKQKSPYLQYYRDVAAGVRKTWDERPALEAKIAAARRRLAEARPVSYVLAVRPAEDWQVTDAAYPPAHCDIENPEVARKVIREAFERLSDLALVPPKVRQENLGAYAYTNLDYAMNGTVELTSGGRLMAGWLSGEDGPRGFFVSNVSADRGETWSEPNLVIDAHDPMLTSLARVTLCGTYWRDPDGKMHLFADQSMGTYAVPGLYGGTTTDGRRGFFESVCANPDAAKPVWSKPRRLSDGHALNKPIVLANGDWLLPVARGVHGGVPYHPAGVFEESWSKVWGAWWLGSSDRGRTWKMRGGVRFPDSQWFEHMCYQMKDGRIRMFARTRKGLMESYSPDNGYTWTKPAFPKGLRQPLSRFHVRRLRSGALLILKHGLAIDADNEGAKPYGARSNLTAWVSDDDGATWTGGLLLEPLECSYPDATEGPDGTIYATYDHQRDRAAEIRMARFTEADVRAGKLVSGGSKLAMRVMKGLKRKGK